MAIHQINLATVSWISRGSLGIYNRPSLDLLSDWLHQLAFGMYHAANPDPPNAFSGQGYVKGQTLQRQYRALMTCSLELMVDERGMFEAVRSLPPIVPPDPGFTPPFDNKFLAAGGAEGKSILHQMDDSSPGVGIMREAMSFHAGEASTLSTIAQPPLQHWQRSATTPLPYGSLVAPRSEVVLAHSLIKFRVASGGDAIAIKAFGAPNHVPWVWCEALLCFAPRALKLYCAGSMFPSHNFYLNGSRRASIPQVFSPPDLTRVFTSGLLAQVQQSPRKPTPLPPDNDWHLFPPRTHVSVNQQTSRIEGATRVPVSRQPFTAPAARTQPVAVVSVH